MEENKAYESANKSNLNDDVEMIKVHTPNFFERHFLHVLIIFGIGFLIFTYVFTIHFKPIYIVGTSMKPTINNQVDDRDIYNTKNSDLVYYQKHSDYAASDIVIIDASNYLPGQTDPIIKRVIATYGNKVTLNFYKIEVNTVASQDIKVYSCYYTLWVDDNELEEDYINEKTCYLTIRTNLKGEYISSNDYTFLKSIYDTLKVESLILPNTYNLETGEYSYTLNPNEYFVCGDNRNHSTDSRYFGAVSKADILGSVKLHIPHGQNLFVTIWKEIFSN